MQKEKITHISRQSHNGFTLIELLVTLLVIAIVAGISLGTVVNLQERTVSQSAQDVIDLLQLASDEAAITGAIQGLFYDKANGVLALRSYMRSVKKQDQSAVGAFGNIIDVISGNNIGNTQETVSNSLEFEDRGHFPDIDMPIWLDRPIHTLTIATDIQLDIELLTANSVNNRLARAMRQIRQNIQNAIDEDVSSQESTVEEAMIRFFPDGSVIPAGQMYIQSIDDSIIIEWDNNGKIEKRR